MAPTSKTYFGDAPWLLAIVLVVFTILAYEPVWHAGFVWDDDVLITENRLVKASDGLHRFWFTTEPPDYFLVTSSLWWMEWRLWGKNPMGYHVVNVLLHAINAVLLWIILRRLRVPGAWLAALVFAVHPVNAATVAWISEQKNTLSMFFYAVAILLYLRFDEEHCWCWAGLSRVALLLALVRHSWLERSMPSWSCIVDGTRTSAPCSHINFSYFKVFQGTSTRCAGRSP